MRLSTKGRYAVTAMLDLALRSQDGPVTLDQLAARQGISTAYLEQLFRRLSKQHLIKGVRGPHGGYQLARAADQITVAQIILAVDEKIDSTQCQGRDNCQNGSRCLTHELWQELSERLYMFLDTVTLEHYLARPSTQQIIDRLHH